MSTITGSVETVVIGGGHAGLVVSRLLTEAGREHVVLERGRIGERWRSERWDSLRLLSPTWANRLPGWYDPSADPEAFEPAGSFVATLERYAASSSAPVHEHVTVRAVSALGGHDRRRSLGLPFRVATDHGTVASRNVVVATGPHGVPRIPEGLAWGEVVHSSAYRNPARLPAGGVLVVGASASGVQIAEELALAGRDVVLAVGRHSRMPRTYRGMDVYWWLETTGRLARTIDEVADPAAARREPSLQLVGRAPGAGTPHLDLGVLQDHGVQITGRLEQITADGVAHLRPDLTDSLRDADRRLRRFLDEVDVYVERAGLAREVWPGHRPRRIQPGPAGTRLDLRARGIGTVVLATGFAPDHSWLRLPVTEPDGSIRQHRGITPAAGLYAVGQRFLHRRDSGFIGGARHDARTVVRHLAHGVLEPATRIGVAGCG